MRNKTAKELANEYVSNHEDSEVRRMYGHHVRSFIAGFEASQPTEPKEVFTVNEVQNLISEMCEIGKPEIMVNKLNQMAFEAYNKAELRKISDKLKELGQ